MPELHTTKPEPKRHDFAAGETGRGPSVPSNGLANDPKAGQWDGRRMSKRMIADYKTFIVTDGEGVRNSLYVSGCPFHCVRLLQRLHLGFPSRPRIHAKT